MIRFKLRITVLFALVAFFVAAYTAPSWAMSADGLKGRLIVGYQGWSGCPGDYEGNSQWPHYFFKNIQDVNHLAIDLLPSVREFSREDLCETDLRRPDGSPIYLYSAQNIHVVEKHFKWMAKYGIDGAALQRFIGLVSERPEMRKRSDHMIANARLAAEESNRVFFITYDVSGANPETVVRDIETDWKHLVNDLKITASPSYLHENGKPVIEIWGFGFRNRPGTPEEVTALIHELKGGFNGLEAVTLIGGVPTNWRTLSGDSKEDPHWASTYRSYDIISPWSVGRFGKDAGADAFLCNHVLPDMAETKRLGIGYMPVIFPGFSRYNQQTDHDQEEKAILNQIPRRCGKFLWHQVYDLLNADVNMIYGAMFDEVDEGTALMPVETREDRLPKGAKMVYLDQDGCSLPDDWYLRIVGKAAEFFRYRKVPESLDTVLKP